MRRAASRSVVLRPVPFLALPVLLATSACDFGTGPEPLPTLLVVNATCAEGACAALDVGGWVPRFAVPGQPVGGFLDIGLVSSASACLTFPAADSLRFGGPDHTTVLHWTPADEVALTVFETGPQVKGGYTETFVPASGPGWRLVYPEAGGTAVLESAEPCET